MSLSFSLARTHALIREKERHERKKRYLAKKERKKRVVEQAAYDTLARTHTNGGPLFFLSFGKCCACLREAE